MTDPKAEGRSAPSRREFLTRSAAAAGAASVLGAAHPLGAAATGRPARPLPTARPGTPLGPDDPIRIAVVGTGGMGTAHCQAFTALAEKGLANLQLVALADVCLPRLENAQRVVAERQKDVPVDTYQDYTELLARDDLHGVLIASPEHWHAKMAEDAIAAGKDVYVEKPMTLDLDDALRLREVVRNNPERILQVGTQYIVQERYHVTQRLIAEGAIDVPTFSQTSYCRNSKDGEWNYYGIDPAWQPGVNLDWDAWCGPLGKAEWDPKVYARWRRYRKYSTGIIGDLLVHQMTPLIQAIDQGWPTRVVASGAHLVDKTMENHDQVNLTVEFETGHIMIVAGSTCNERGLEIMVRGHKGTLFLGNEDVVLRPERLYLDEVDEQKVECRSKNDHDEVRLDWLNSIRTRQPNLSQVDLGTKVMVIVDLATRSMWEGKAFSFDPETMTARAV
jgi:predicted dehydrogenase